MAKRKWTPNVQITKDGKRQYTVGQKRLILREHVEQGVSISALSRKYQVHPVTIYSWKRMINLTEEFKDPHGSIDELLEELDRLKKENHRLKLAVGELTVDKTCQQELIDSLKKKSREVLLKESRKPSSPSATASSGPARNSVEPVNGSTSDASEEGNLDA